MISLSCINKGMQLRAPRMIICGGAKVGKSTFAAASDSPIFIPIKGEEGIDSINVDSFPTAKNFQDVLDSLTALYKEEHNYRTVVIDSISTLEPLIWDAICKKDNVTSIVKACNGYGNGYVEAIKYWRNITEILDHLRSAKNMASILIGHVKVKAFNDPSTESYDRYQLDIHEKAAEALIRWVDFTGFCKTKIHVKEDGKAVEVTVPGKGQRFLYTKERPAHPGGGRGPYGHIPYEIPLSWPAFIDEVSKAYNAINNNNSDSEVNNNV